MGRSTDPDPEPSGITFLDGVDPSPVTSEEIVRSGRSGTSAVVGLAAAVLVVVAVSVGRTSSPIPDDGPAPRVAPVSPMFADETVLPEASPLPDETELAMGWPTPPDDHDPQVSRIPGAGVPLVAAEDVSAVVYVNTLGHPTVVDVRTGEVHEIDVAATRLRDVFAVEDGAVRGLDGVNPGLTPAGPDAIRFHVRRQVDLPPVFDETERIGELRPPVLCPGAPNCEGTDRVEAGAWVIERFDPVEHPAVATLFAWPTDRRWHVGDDGVRFPRSAEREPARTWVVRTALP